VAAALLLSAGVWHLRQFIRFPATELQSAGASKAVFYSGSVLGFATCILQIYNLIALGDLWPFLTAIVVSLSGATLQFARLVLSPPSRR
jgi:hypothetical protein